LRDEKWRFDPETGSTAVSRRNGFRDMDDFHLVDATLDALGSFTKSYRMNNEHELLKHRVNEPHMSKDVDYNVRNEASNGFSGVSINTQYSTQNGYPHVSNVVGIQHLNAPNQYNGLNFQQAFATPGFGFQQHGSLYNHQTHFPSNPSTFPNNHNFQLSSFLMPFFNQHINNNNSPNQHQIFGQFPSFGTIGVENGQGYGPEQVTDQQHVISATTIPTTDALNHFPGTTKATEPSASQSTTEPILVVETTEDPTLNFDIRLEKDRSVAANETGTQNIQTSSRRPIEGLPATDEDSDDGGILDDKINPQPDQIAPGLLKTLVG